MRTRILHCLLAVAIALTSIAAHSQVKVAVNLQHSQGAYQPIYNWFGYDEDNYTYMQHGPALLQQLHDLSPVPVYMRTHNLLTTGDGVANLKWGSTNVYTVDAQNNPVYDWTIIDKIFDAYAAAHVRPMVEIGFMPEALSVHPEPYHIQFPANISQGGWSQPPTDYKRWGELVRRLTEHLVQRYGRENAITWYWEVWNEPDGGYWHGTPEDYDRLYDYTVAGVRAALPDAKVGGPGTTGPGKLGTTGHSSQFLDQFLVHCEKGKSAVTGGRVPLDFISFHAKGSPKLTDGVEYMGLQHELQDTAHGFAIVSQHPALAKLPIILSEADPEGCAACSARNYPQNVYRNGTLYPSYTAAAMKGLLDLQQQYHVNLISMLTWAFEFEGRDYFEGFRSLATNGVDKPVLNFFRMAGMMQGNRVEAHSSGNITAQQILDAGVRDGEDVDVLATRSTHEAAVMLWNYHDAATKSDAAEISVSIAGVPVGVHRVLLQHYRIDDDHSNAYTVWKAMGSPQQPTDVQIAQLKEAGQLQLLDSPQWIEVNAGHIDVDVSLPGHGLSLLHLNW
jgi:xylan 1,4-beta-xylosidase